VSGVTTPYLYDGQNPAMISTNQMLAGAGLDEIYAQINSSGTTSYMRDGLNSTVALTNSSAATTANYSYSPYGDSASTGTASTPLQYTGREDDGATGLYFYRARYYSPQLGRFISEDPIGLAGGTNYYAYALGDPVDNNDPNGEFVPLIVILPVIGGLVGGISDVLTATSCQNKWAAFGRGFVSGATGTLVGLGVTALTGNPWLAGAAAGEISSISDQALAGESLDPIKVAASTGLGAVGGKLLSRAFPTVGRLPSMTLPRTLQNTGLNSQRLMIQESGTDALGGGGQYLLNAIQSPAGEGCGCK